MINPKSIPQNNPDMELYSQISDKDLRLFDDLASRALSRTAGDNVEVRLVPFAVAKSVPLTKSRVIGATVNVQTKGVSVTVPTNLVVKKYHEGRRGTSDYEDTSLRDFRAEKAVLDLGISMLFGGETRRIYPILYSGQTPECDSHKVIIREFLPEKSLEEIAIEQEANGGLKWAAAVGQASISDSLFPIALLHAKTPAISQALKERHILKAGPEEVNPAVISADRARRFARYIQVLVEGKGMRLDGKDTSDLASSYLNIDKQIVSRKGLLSIIDGELDVFSHHAMLKRLPDAGGVEVGSRLRDLALYSAPAFKSLWSSPINMAQTVLETYFNLISQLEERLRYSSPGKTSAEQDIPGLIFASFAGNVRKPAAAVYYAKDQSESFHFSRARYDPAPETTRYLANSFVYLDAFKSNFRAYCRDAEAIGGILEKYGLRDPYVYSPRQAGLHPDIPIVSIPSTLLKAGGHLSHFPTPYARQPFGKHHHQK